MPRGSAATEESRDSEGPMLVAARFTEIIDSAETYIREYTQLGRNSLPVELGRAAMHMNARLVYLGRSPWARFRNGSPVPVMFGPDTLDLEHSTSVHTPRMLETELVRRERDEPYVDSVSFRVPGRLTGQGRKRWTPLNVLIIRHHYESDSYTADHESFGPDWYRIAFDENGDLVPGLGLQHNMDKDRVSVANGVTDCAAVLSSDPKLAERLRLSDAEYLLPLGLIAMGLAKIDGIILNQVETEKIA